MIINTHSLILIQGIFYITKVAGKTRVLRLSLAHYMQWDISLMPVFHFVVSSSFSCEFFILLWVFNYIFFVKSSFYCKFSILFSFEFFILFRFVSFLESFFILTFYFPVSFLFCCEFLLLLWAFYLLWVLFLFWVFPFIVGF